MQPLPVDGDLQTEGMKMDCVGITNPQPKGCGLQIRSDRPNNTIKITLIFIIKRKKVLIVLLAMPFMALAQEEASWGNSVRLSYGLMGNTPSTLQDPLEGSGFEDIDAMYGSATVEWSRQINRWLELGLYAGFREGAMLHVTRDFLYIGPSGDTTYTDLEACEKHLTLSYGFTARAHLLPLMGKSNDHWDVYAALHIGGWYCVGNRLEYGLGAGACWYFTRRLGLYAEGLFGQYQAQNFGHLLKGDGKVNVGIVFKY